MNVKDIKKPLLLFLTLFTFITVSLYGIIYYTSSENDNRVKLITASEQISSRIKLNLHFILNRDMDLASVIVKSIHFSTENSIPLEKQEEFIKDIFKDTITKHKCIFQMRLIDKNGIEKIRVERFPNLKEDRISISTDLQDKSDSYYMKEARKTKDIFFSDIDYNMEHGKIEIPLILTTRMVNPIWTDNEFQGAIIINFDVKKIIESVVIDPSYDLVLLKNYPEEFNIVYSSFNIDTENMLKIEENIRNNDYNGVFEDLTDNNTFTKLTVFTKLSDRETDRMSDESLNRIFFTIFSIIISAILFGIIMTSFIKKIMFQMDDIEHLNDHLEKLNDALDRRVKMELTESRKKDMIMMEQSKLASMGEMISNIAHQWRQPLSLIRTTATAISLKKEMNSLTDKYLMDGCESISNQCNYLSNTIDTFRNFLSKSKDLQVISIKQEIYNALSMVKDTLESRNIELLLEISDDTLMTLNYNGEITECIINIINNSMDVFESDNTIANPYVKITTDRTKGNAIITVEDNAKGIPEEILPRIFEPYFTTKHKSKGTGLGLHIVNNIIKDRFMGDITVENTEEGVRFTIKIPLNENVHISKN